MEVPNHCATARLQLRISPYSALESGCVSSLAYSSAYHDVLQSLPAPAARTIGVRCLPEDVSTYHLHGPVRADRAAGSARGKRTKILIAYQSRLLTMITYFIDLSATAYLFRTRFGPHCFIRSTGPPPCLASAANHNRSVRQDMLVTYQNVFFTPCASCQGILSQEGFMPPIARIWREPNGDGAGTWESRHITCMKR